MLTKGDTNILRLRPNGRHFAHNIFKRIFLNEKFRTFILISLKVILKCSFNNKSALVQIIAWRRSSDKPLSEPMMVALLKHTHTHLYIYIYASFGLNDLPSLKYNIKLHTTPNTGRSLIRCLTHKTHHLTYPIEYTMACIC